MINFLRNFKVNARIWTLTVLSFLGMLLIVFEYSGLVSELKAGTVSASEFEAHQTTVFIIVGALLAAILGFSWAITSSIMSPLRRLQAELTALSEGKYDQPVTDMDHADGIAGMARAAEFLRKNSLETEQLRADAETARVQRQKEEHEFERLRQEEDSRRRDAELAQQQAHAAEREKMQHELAGSFESEVSNV
ncbi:MAG: hypothetical protein JKY57_02520, partial [Kordiimonadaceae bacterium]|nr:hypothetical protein [Kordiimonadaceae bacterium]